jgi:hypothetical protein
MDERKIVLVNLSIGQVGESNANLLGSMLTTKIFLAGMSRASLSKAELAAVPNFYLYIDEFQNLANESFADILSQSRKYKLNLTLAHQYIEQMPETVRAAVFGNVGTMITFRVGATDAEIFEREFGMQFLASDFVALDRYQIYLSLMIDGVGSPPFSARTLPPLPMPAVSLREEVIAHSRANYARPRSGVESAISGWMDASLSAPKIKPNNGMPDKKKQQKNKAADKPTPPTEELPGTNDFKQALAGIDLGTDSSDANNAATTSGKPKRAKGGAHSKHKHTKPKNDLGDFIKQVEEDKDD